MVRDQKSEINSSTVKQIVEIVLKGFCAGAGGAGGGSFEVTTVERDYGWACVKQAVLGNPGLRKKALGYISGEAGKVQMMLRGFRGNFDRKLDLQLDFMWINKVMVQITSLELAFNQPQINFQSPIVFEDHQLTAGPGVLPNF